MITADLMEARFHDLGLGLTFGDHVDERDDFDSAPIGSRVADLHAAFADAGVHDILTVIGGFNSNRPALVQLRDARPPGDHPGLVQQGLPQRRAPAGIRGLIIGRFQQASGMSRNLLEQILHRQEALIGLPVMANVDFGHTSPLATLPVGGQVEVVTGDAARIRVLQH